MKCLNENVCNNYSECKNRLTMLQTTAVILNENKVLLDHICESESCYIYAIKDIKS